MKRRLKTLWRENKYIMLCVILAVILMIVGVIWLWVDYMKKSLAETIGLEAGRVMGSFEALADYREAYAEGKEEGLSAEDTTAEVTNKVQELKKLEVLVAGVKLKNMHSVGNKDYAVLYLLKGDAVFTVDFSEAEICQKENTLSITIPEPEMQLLIDQSKMEMAAEYQKFFWSGEAEDGFDAYLVSMAKIQENSKEALVNYDALIESAKEAAEKQVKQLVHSVSISGVKVEVQFKETEKALQESDSEVESEIGDTKEESHELGDENE